MPRKPDTRPGTDRSDTRPRARARTHTRPGGKAECPGQPSEGKAKWPNGDLAGIWRSALEIIGFFRKRSEGPFLALYLAEGRGLEVPACSWGPGAPDHAAGQQPWATH